MTLRFDWILLISVGLLTVIGLVVLHAITFRDPSLEAGFNPAQQVVAAALGLAALIVAARMDYRIWLRAAIPWYLVAVILLGVLLFVGEVVFGATRGIHLGFLDFQPTEVAKLGLILLLARLYALHSLSLRRLRYFALSLLIVGVIAALVFLQPDIGSVAVLGFIWLLMTLMSNIRKTHVLVLMVVLAVSAPFAIGQLEPYQQQRLETFFNPAADPQDAGYNVNQAKIAVGSGQIFGRGLGGGTQSQLNFLPAQHTDFVFAVLAEKLGLLGAGLVMSLFGVVLFRGLYIAYHARDKFGSLLAGGIVAMFLVQIIISIGMNLGVAPVTGLPLPFISYGGTSLVMSLFAVGLLLSVSANKQKLEFKE